MSATLPRDRRAERFAATRQEILAAAWELARADGLGSIAMRELGGRVGMRAQSLYAYFPSKHAIYDAMFAEANRELYRRIEAVAAADAVDQLCAHGREFLTFCIEDPVRYQLLYQRTIPGFEPSPESYAPAVEIITLARGALAACGVTDPRALDVWTALIGGLAAQQNANEPGGQRWAQLLEDSVEMYLAHHSPPPTRRRR